MISTDLVLLKGLFSICIDTLDTPYDLKKEKHKYFEELDEYYLEDEDASLSC